MAKDKSLVIKSGSFMTDVQELRRRARSHIEQGAVTEGYRADVDTVLRVLNEALATEIVCVLRYKRHHYMAAGIHATAVAEEFLEHANAEQRHADQIAERIVIESYSEIIRFLGNDDPSSRRLMEETLAEEEDHANDLRTLIESLGLDRITRQG